MSLQSFHLTDNTISRNQADVATGHGSMAAYCWARVLTDFLVVSSIYKEPEADEKGNMPSETAAHAEHPLCCPRLPVHSGRGDPNLTCPVELTPPHLQA